MNPAMQVTIYTKGTSGAATTTEAETPIVTSLSFTHSAMWGPYEASFNVTGSIDDAFRYADEYLGNGVGIYAPDGTQVWEGLIWSIAIGMGARSRTRSLEGYANRTRIHYQLMDFSTSPPTDLGLATPITANDTAQQAIYGIIEWQDDEGGIETATATAKATEALARRKRLLWVPDGNGGSGNGVSIQVQCVGWYRTLWYQGYTASTTGTADVSTVIQNILTSKAPFISTDYTRMATTSTNVQRQFDKYEYPGDLITKLVGRATNYLFQLDYGRVPVLKTSQRLSTTVTYNESPDGTITDADQLALDLWLVRPDAVLRQVDFAPGSFSATSAAVESVENIYLERTTWSTPNTLTYEPAVMGVLGEVEA